MNVLVKDELAGVLGPSVFENASDSIRSARLDAGNEEFSCRILRDRTSSSKTPGVLASIFDRLQQNVVCTG